MKGIVLHGRVVQMIDRNAYQATYIFRDQEAGEFKIRVPKRIGKFYRDCNQGEQSLLVKLEGRSYQRSLGDPVYYANDLVVVKILK